MVGGIPTPLKNDGVRQLGWWHSQLNGKSLKKSWFQTTNQNGNHIEISIDRRDFPGWFSRLHGGESPLFIHGRNCHVWVLQGKHWFVPGIPWMLIDGMPLLEPRLSFGKLLPCPSHGLRSIFWFANLSAFDANLVPWRSMTSHEVT